MHCGWLETACHRRFSGCSSRYNIHERPLFSIGLTFKSLHTNLAMAILNIIDASGRQWNYTLKAKETCTIGRAPDHCVVLDDPRASRHHAHINGLDETFTIVDGAIVGGQIRRSANKVFINNEPRLDHVLR